MLEITSLKGIEHFLVFVSNNYIYVAFGYKPLHQYLRFIKYILLTFLTVVIVVRNMMKLNYNYE